MPYSKIEEVVGINLGDSLPLFLIKLIASSISCSLTSYCLISGPFPSAKFLRATPFYLIENELTNIGIPNNAQKNFWEAIKENLNSRDAVSYTHLRAHETPEHLVSRLLR